MTELQDVLGETFRKELEKSNPDQRFNVLIIPKRDSRLERSVAPRYTRYSQEEIRASRQKIRDSLQPICDYLKKLEVDYTPSNKIGVVNAFLTPNQIYELAEQSLVGAISKDLSTRSG